MPIAQKEITKRQKELLAIIYEYIRDTGYPPTFEDMREALGVASNQSIIDLLEKLQASGAIKRREGARSLIVLPLGYELLGRSPLVSFAGVTNAGLPTELFEVHEWEQLSNKSNDGLAKLKGEVALLRVAGDSMINAGIDNGDIVLVEKRNEFFSGEIVWARIGSESTIKRFISEDKPPHTYLKPENPRYDIILFTDDTALEGKVLSVFKQGDWKIVK